MGEILFDCATFGESVSMQDLGRRQIFSVDKDKKLCALEALGCVGEGLKC